MRNPIRLLSITSLVAGVLVLGLFLHSGSASVQHLTLDPHYILVRSDRVSHTVFDYTYRAKMTNRGPADYLGVSATLTSRSSRTVVVDGSLTFGDIPAGSTVTSSDTFTIRRDRSDPLNPAYLVWQIAGTPVQHLAIKPPYILVRSDRVSHTVFDYTYRAKMANRGLADYLGVSATLTSRSFHTVVVDGSLTFGDIAAGSTVISSDTFTIYHPPGPSRPAQSCASRVADCWHAGVQEHATRGPCRARSDGRGRAAGDSGWQYVYG